MRTCFQWLSLYPRCPSTPASALLPAHLLRLPAVLSFTPRFSPSPLISPVANILTSFHFSILHRVNVSARLFSYLTFLFLPLTSSLLDSTPWGCKIISSSATMLGLFLHSPLSQPTPLYDEQMSLLPRSPPFTRSTVEAAQLRKPIATMQKRTRACSALGLSFRDRTIFLSFYVLSLPVYHPLYPVAFISLLSYLLYPDSSTPRSTTLDYKPPNCPASLLTYALAFCIALIFILHALYSATVYAVMVNLLLCGCAMSPPLYLPCLPNFAKGYTPFVGCFSPLTLTTPSLSSTLSNVTFTTTIHPINSLD